MADKKVQSPDSLQIRGTPMASARLSKKAALGAVALGAVVLGFIIINVSKPKQKSASRAAEAPLLEPAQSAAKTLTADVPDLVTAAKPADVPVLPALPASPPPRFASSSNIPRERPREDNSDLARLAGTEIPGFSRSASRRPSSAASAAQSDRAERGVSGEPGFLNTAQTGTPDLNRQAEKQAFLERARPAEYLQRERTAPLSPFEIKTGTVIPSVLISEVNSDLPGEIIAQVAQNVYDTSSGNHLLIPQGTKLYGHYDSQVSFGQGRLLVSWQRLIYPDASTLELEGMGGYDRAGNAGFKGKVNNHYGRIFGFALLTSIISAGYQISQPQQNSTLTPLSNQQIAAGAVGQQMADLGVEMARRNMQVQPTIKIRKGYRLHVMVNKDVVFPDTYQHP